MFVEHFEKEDIENMFLEDYQRVVKMSVRPIRGRGKTFLDVKFAQSNCGEEETFNLFVSDHEVRRPKNGECFEIACLDRIATTDLREFLTAKYGAKYQNSLDEFLHPTQSLIIK